MRTLLTALALLVPLALAGCLAPPASLEDASSPDDREAAAPPPADRVDGMTAEASQEDSSGPCDDGSTRVPPMPWCATRVLTVQGRIGVDSLPVDLSSVNGGIVVRGDGAGDAWSFVATVKTRGASEEDARAALDEAWSWSHEGPEGHHLRAGPADAAGALPLPVPVVLSTDSRLAGAQYELVLPSWVLLDVEAETSNGAIELLDVRAGSLRARTSNGAITATGTADDADLSTSNGRIEADLRPSASGEYEMSTSNGAISLTVPEGAAHGYDLDARTSNGDIDIRLRDGQVDEEERGHARFRTDRHDARGIQTSVKLDTSNGAIEVAPA